MKAVVSQEEKLREDLAFSRHFIASEAAVRDVLCDVRSWLISTNILAEVHGTTELVLAEALNNIVEHAYALQSPGQVQVNIWPHADHLTFELQDNGRPLPAWRIETAELPTLDCEVSDLPEGGFGWFLIHHLTQALEYERCADQNRLCFEIAINEPTKP